MSKSERCKLLNDELQHAIRKETPGSLFEKVVAQYKDLPALVHDDKTYSYDEVRQRALGLSAFLQSFLGEESAPVCVFMDRSPELAIAMLGILSSGHTFVPLDPLLPKERLENFLNLVNPKLILHLETAPNYLREKWQLVSLSSDLYSNEKADTAPINRECCSYIVAPYHKELVNATPASTVGLLNIIFWTQCTHNISMKDRFAVTQRPGLDGSICEMLTALLSGASLYFPSEATIQDPKELIAWCAENQISRLHLPTTLTELLLCEQWDSNHPLKTLFTGGKQLTKRGKKLPFQIVNRYGPSENGLFSFEGVVNSSDKEVIIPIGSAISNIRFAILDDNLQEVEKGKPGQLAVGGPGLINGYYNQKDKDGRAFILHTRLGRRPERLFLTGDRVRQRADGQLEFLGRCRVTANCGIINLESILGEHPRIKQIAAKNNSWGEISVYWVKKPGKIASSKGVLNYLKGRVSPDLMPRQIIELQTLPLDLSGKIQYNQLPESSKNEEEVIPPKNGVEKRLIDICHEVLRKFPLSVRKNFHDMGLGTEGFLTLTSLIEKHLERKIPVSTLYFHPTVEKLAKALATEPIETLHLQTIQAGNSDQTVICVSRSDGELYPFFNIAKQLQSEWNIVGLSLPNLPPEDLGEFLQNSLVLIREKLPNGPYRFVGEGMGGSIAFALASKLSHEGAEVLLTCLIDAPCPLTTAAAEAGKRMQALMQSLKRASNQNPKEFIAQKYQEYEVRLWHKLGLSHFADHEITLASKSESKSAWWKGLRKSFKDEAGQIKQLYLFNQPQETDSQYIYDGWNEVAAKVEVRTFCKKHPEPLISSESQRVVEEIESTSAVKL